MDIIRPNFIVVNGRCFRSFYSQSNAASFRPNPEDEIEEDEPLECLEEELDEEDVEINQESDSMFVHLMLVPPEFYGLIIGAKGL